MKVLLSKPMSPTCSLEIGLSTWDANEMSIRLRFDGDDGRFDPRSSSEIPMLSLVDIVTYAIKCHQVSTADMAKIIEAAGAEVDWQLKNKDMSLDQVVAAIKQDESAALKGK